MKKIRKILIAVFSLIFLSLANVSSATLFSEKLPKKCRDEGDCTLTDMISVVANGVDWILSIVGAAALVMFIYGGFTFLISAGNEEQVKKGRGILQGAIIGLIIVFASYLIINFILTSMGYDKTGFGEWYSTSEAQI